MRFLMLNWRDPKNPLAGGAERVTQACLAALVGRGHRACWFTYDFPGAKAEEEIDGITIVRAGGKGSSILKATAWYRRQQPFDLVIDQHHGIPWYAPWWCRTNCIGFIHEVLGPIWGSFYPWPVSLIGRWQERWTHWLYRDVPFWVPSPSTKEALHRHGVRHVTFLSNGIDTATLPALDDKPLVSPLRLIVVSRLAPNKRVDHCVRALQCLLANGMEAHLTIVGGGMSERQLRELGTTLGVGSRLTFKGSLSEAQKDEELRRAHVLIHTSVREGWGLNVTEAAARGTPAVVYPVAGLVDSTRHNETGLVAATETPEALAAALAQLLNYPAEYQRLRRNALERARQLSWRNVLPKSCEWLEEQAAQKRAPAVKRG